jgi:hypothetical protein
MPSAGGIPVKLTFDKRPFTPPFAQLIKMQPCQSRPPSSKQSSRPKPSDKEHDTTTADEQ